MACVTKAKQAWDLLIDAQEPIAGVLIERPHLKKAAIIGGIGLVLVASTIFLAWCIFVNPQNRMASKIAEGMSKHHSYAALTIAGGSILSAIFLIAAANLTRCTHLSPMTLETKDTLDGKERWTKDLVQPFYINYDARARGCYLVKDRQGDLVATTRIDKSINFVERDEKRIVENVNQIVHSGLNGM